MTKPIIAVPTGTAVIYLGVRSGCVTDLHASGTLAVWKADCGTGARTTVSYPSFGMDAQGRLKFILDDAWLLTAGRPTVGRWDGTLTTSHGCVPLRFQLGGRGELASAVADPGYTYCNPEPDCTAPAQTAQPLPLYANDGYSVVGHGLASGAVVLNANDDISVLCYADASSSVAHPAQLLSNDGSTSLGFIAP